MADTTKMTLRLPTALHDALTAEAAKRAKSLNQEIVDRLIVSTEAAGGSTDAELEGRVARLEAAVFPSLDQDKMTIVEQGASIGRLADR